MANWRELLRKEKINLPRAANGDIWEIYYAIFSSGRRDAKHSSQYESVRVRVLQIDVHRRTNKSSKVPSYITNRPGCFLSIQPH